MLAACIPLDYYDYYHALYAAARAGKHLYKPRTVTGSLSSFTLGIMATALTLSPFLPRTAVHAPTLLLLLVLGMLLARWEKLATAATDARVIRWRFDRADAEMPRHTAAGPRCAEMMVFMITMYGLPYDMRQ
jgi:hypothetical protein